MKKVLSIDGGGVFGIFAAYQLQAIEDACGKPLHEEFDLVCGTSVGAILAGLVAQGYSAQDIINMMEDEVQNIFTRSTWQRIKTLNGLRGSKYDHKVLSNILSKYFMVPLGSCKTNFMCVSYDTENSEPFFFKSWNQNDEATFMTHAIRASVSAPTFFKPVVYKPNITQIDQTEGQTRTLIDGGLVANNPAMCAYAESRVLWGVEQIRLFSVGTGKSDFNYLRRDMGKWWIWKWAQAISGLFIDGGVDAVDYQLRAIANTTSNLRYERSDHVMGAGFSKMDDVSEDHISLISTSGIIEQPTTEHKYRELTKG